VSGVLQLQWLHHSSAQSRLSTSLFIATTDDET